MGPSQGVFLPSFLPSSRGIVVVPISILHFAGEDEVRGSVPARAQPVSHAAGGRWGAQSGLQRSHVDFSSAAGLKREFRLRRSQGYQLQFN